MTIQDSQEVQDRRRARGTDVARVHTGRHVSWPVHGALTLIAVAALNLVTWWLLVDPAWSIAAIYPQPFTDYVFWLLLATVWVGFTFQWSGPAGWRQPWRGFAAIGLMIVIGVGMTLLVTYGWGHFDPSFAATRDGGLGYTTSSLFVLFGFFFYVCANGNQDHWPFVDNGSRLQSGLGRLTFLLVPTLIGFMVLVLPNLAVWAVPGTALMSTPTVIGWFYQLVVASVLTGTICENLPWRLAGTPGRVALAALVGNAALGTLLYFAELAVAKLLMGEQNVTALGAGVTAHAAELGVIWVFWQMLWANGFGNRPTRYATGVNIAIRIAVTFALACATYPLYYFVLAPGILHEPVTAGTLHGDAFTFGGWATLLLLWYVLFLESYGVPKPRDRPGNAT